jgi:CxxC motif-containing protein (DUF1111 family)
MIATVTSAAGKRHRGEAHDAERRFDELSPEERAALITFLNSL